MTSPKWEDTEEIVEVPSFEETEDILPIEEGEEPSQLEAGLRGAGQEVSFGLSDEILGALGAAKETALGDDRLENLIETYKRERDIQREAEKEAEEAHPGTYLAGQVVGGIAPALFTGGGSAMASLATKGLSKAAMTQAAKAGAKYGAGQAFGRAEGDLGEHIKETAIGAGIGGATGAVSPIIGEAVSSTGKYIKDKIAKPAMDSILAFTSGLKKADVRQILNSPQLVRKAKEIGELGEIVAQKADDLYNDIGLANKRSKDVLSSEKAIKIEQFTDNIDSMIDNAKFTANEPAIKHLNRVKSLLKKKSTNGKISDLNVKEVMEDIGKTAYKGLKKDTEDVVKVELRKVRRDMSSYLKGKNEVYKDYIDPLEEKYGILDDLQRVFKLENVKNKFTVGSEDVLERKLRQVGKTGYSDVESLLKRTSGILDDKGIVDEVKSARLAEELTKETGINWGMKDLIRMAIGGGVAGPIGIAAAIGSKPVSRQILKQSDIISKIASVPVETVNKMLKNKIGVSAAFGVTQQIGRSDTVKKTVSNIMNKGISSDGKNNKGAIPKMTKNIVNSSQEEISSISQILREKGIEQYANVLDSIAKLPKKSRTARMTMLMQQKAFKEAIGYNEELKND